MLHPDEDMSARCAMQRLSDCTTCLEKFRTAIRSLLDDIHIAEWNWEMHQKMTLWIHGRYSIDGVRDDLKRYILDADNFLWSDEFDTLDATKKWDYFDVITRIGRDHEKLEIQYAYYALLGDIECSERTMSDFARMLKRSYHYITYRKWIGALKNRGLNIHKQRIKNLEDHIKVEIKQLLMIIERAIIHPLFQEMSRKKRNSYHEKWKQYQDELWKIDPLS